MVSLESVDRNERWRGGTGGNGGNDGNGEGEDFCGETA